MSNPTRSSDVVENFATDALTYGIGGLLTFGFGALCFYYQGMLATLGMLLMAGGVAAMGYAIYRGTRIREVSAVGEVCPYCHAKNVLTEAPTESFSCVECHRMIPVQGGKILAVQQVRCGFCNHLNYYNETSVGLICEECDREIPIATADGQLATKSFHMFTRHDDDKYYDLVLVESGKKTEEVISCLQHMLALNRNQVKQMLDELPVTLLTGINKMKADMLNAQLSAHDAVGQVAESKEQG